MRFFALPDGVINNLDRAQFLTTPFDKVFGAVSLTQSITISETISVTHVKFASIIQSLTISQSLSQSPIIKSLSQSITISQTISFILVHNRSITQSLSLTQSISLNGIYNKSIIQSLIINQQIIEFLRNLFQHVTNHLEINADNKELINLDIGQQSVYKPLITATITPKKCLVILASEDLNIILPCPLFGDSEANVAQLSMKRTMNGSMYVYSKQSDLKKLSYRFNIERNKAYELHNFLVHNMSKLINMINWKGEKYLTYITNNPIDMVAKALRSSCGEYLEVQLDFEGSRI